MSEEDTKTDLSPRPPAPESLDVAILPRGAQLGEYCVDSVCGQGGFATVYRAANAAGEWVAVKVLHPRLGASGQILDRFRRETELLARLDDPRFVRVLAVGELGAGRPWYAMEWIDGQTLEAVRRQRGAFSLPETVAVAEELCSALALAHREGIIHRDLKGENVMLLPAEQGFRLKLLDLGIAKLLEDEGAPGMTRTGMRLGTPAYMSPEQILGRPVDARSDIYALGVLLYRLLTGHLPYSGTTLAQLEEQHLRAPVPRPSLQAAVPLAADPIITRCMAKDPADRYATVGELLAALRGLAGPPAAFVVPEVTHDWYGVYVDLVGEAELDDEHLDLADGAFEAITRRARDDGMTVALATGTAVLLALPAERVDADTVVSRVHELRELVPLDVRPSFRFTVHRGEASLRPDGGLGGELLRLATWTGHGAAGEVLVSASVAVTPRQG